MRIEAIDEQFLLILKSGDQSRGRIISLLGLSASGFWRHSQKLNRYRLIRQPRYKYYALTKQGKAFVEQLSGTVTPSVREELDGIINLLPTIPHQAFFRLLLSGVVAKKCLIPYFDDLYPAFIVCGRTATLKTSLANFACRVFGLDPATHIYLVTSALPKELGVRRVREKGKRDFDISASPYLEEPFICFDELDKANKEVKKAALAYADGTREFLAEGKTVPNHVCAMMTLNTELNKIPIPNAYIRRSVVLNTDPLVPELTDVDLIVKKIFDSRIPRIDLESFPVKVTKLSDKEHTFLRDLLKGAVKPDAWSVKIDTQPVEILTLGRLILTQTSDIKEAIYATVYDRLSCLETIGATVEDWREPFNEEWAGYQGKRKPGLKRERKELKRKQKKWDRTIKGREEEKQTEDKQKILAGLAFVRKQEALLQKILSGKRVEPFSLRSGEWVAKTKPVKKVIDDLAAQIRRVGRGDLERLSMLEEIASQLKAEQIDPIIGQYQSAVACQKKQKQLQREQEEEARLVKKKEQESEKEKRREETQKKRELAAIEREEERIEKALDKQDLRTVLTFEEKASIKRLDECLRRRVVEIDGDVGSVLQGLGIIKKITKADIPHFTFMRDLTALVFENNRKYVDYFRCEMDNSTYRLDHFTDWEKARPLLEMKKQQILTGAQARCERRLADLKRQRKALLGDEGKNDFAASWEKTKQLLKKFQSDLNEGR